jgi:aldose 1-epimerase
LVPPPYEVREVLYEGYPARTLIDSAAELEATFAPRIGMIGCSLTHAGDELLGQRGGLARYEATGSTMGIPLLHPWANRLAEYSYAVDDRRVELDPDSPLVHKDPNDLPIHGLVAASPYWELMATLADPDAARLSANLDFGAHPEYLEGFPFPHELRLDVSISNGTLTIRTTLTATGDVAVPLSFGFHPYLQLPDVPREDWHVEIPATRHLVLDDRMIPTGESEPVTIEPGKLGERTFDDAYTDLGDEPRFVLAGGGRRLVVQFIDGYDYAQVYAPDDQDVICFEPMTAPANALVSGDDLELVPPGETATASFSIAVERG